ncbi:hypothetical protein ACFCV3_08220 [Kribbella sp. NPDC056345]|uniref:hypothetical protein n=1 Tax=Kribbella sp. NPDC056345 TaxID=3345789 RepID=UPI0035DBE57C
MSDAGLSSRMHMLPGPTSKVLDAIQQPMDDWTNEWSRLSSAIRQDEIVAKTGFDDVSKQFRDSYNLAEPDLSSGAANVSPTVVQAVGKGRTIVARYVATFGAMGDAMKVPGANRTLP